ncbi:MAG: permease-like cell division protein FtsX [Muribaculaceae bacterium]|nr:permease-like cell division protein FtsX [Muribaculaceae bacterium]
MKRKSLSDKTIFTKHLTSTVSVMLVMFTLGLVGTIVAGTKGVTDMLKSRTGFTIIMTDEAQPSEISAVSHALSADNSIRYFSFKSAEENMSEWNRENEEDVLQILGVNPFPADFTVRVFPDWSAPDILASLGDRYAAMAGVSEITLSTSAVSNLHHFISTVNWILTVIAAGLLLISFVLINNTVRLTVYSRRFLIHTMKLVGATGSFIRGPFVRSGILSGLTAGVIASGLLAGLISFAHSKHAAVSDCIPWSALWWLFPAIILAAMAVCSIASILATNRYLRMDYDDLF